MTGIHISDRLDSGSIVVVGSGAGSPEDPILLKLKPEHCFESPGTFQQWFHFVASNMVAGEKVAFSIVDASESTYPDWRGYNVCMSYDLETWHRIAATTFEDGKLTWSHTPQHSTAYYAYFPPYGRERQLEMLHAWQSSPSKRCRVHVLGQTLDGHDLHLLTVGSPVPALEDRGTCAKLTVWVHARQHPGETAASWWIDGLLGRLLDPTDAVVRDVLGAADFFIVPNMNPDGGVRGHLRTNACGANLNREWRRPSMERSPEVALAQRAMQVSIDTTWTGQAPVLESQKFPRTLCFDSCSEFTVMHGEQYMAVRRIDCECSSAMHVRQGSRNKT